MHVPSDTQAYESFNYRQDEVDKFGAFAQRWWDIHGPQRALHALNPVRLNYVKQRIALPGAAMLDVGCGGGLLSEALAKEQARVTAIDLSPELIDVARLHQLESNLEIDYRVATVESLAEASEAQYVAITCMEMLEHVPDPGAIIAACARLLQPGGRLFLSTLNRTPLAYGLAIVGAEYIARLLPKGTHHYRKFIRPSELAAWIRAAGLELEDISGVAYEPFCNSARLSRRTAVNYLACASRPRSAS